MQARIAGVSVLVALGLFAIGAVAADLPKEAPIVPQSLALDEPGRYQSSRSYDETLDYYERVFRRTGGVRWRSIVNLPGIKAKNIESLRRTTDWEGINIYEKQGEVRIFVIAREKPLQDPSARSKSRPR
ncbi:MAG: hypothetical protein AAB426_11220 [Myxococcota bacterium]